MPGGRSVAVDHQAAVTGIFGAWSARTVGAMSWLLVPECRREPGACRPSSSRHCTRGRQPTPPLVRGRVLGPRGAPGRTRDCTTVFRGPASAAARPRATSPTCWRASATHVAGPRGEEASAEVPSTPRSRQPFRGVLSHADNSAGSGCRRRPCRRSLVQRVVAPAATAAQQGWRRSRVTSRRSAWRRRRRRARQRRDFARDHRDAEAVAAPSRARRSPADIHEGIAGLATPAERLVAAARSSIADASIFGTGRASWRARARRHFSPASGAAGPIPATPRRGSPSTTPDVCTPARRSSRR